MPEQDDSSLIQSVLKGNQAAFSTLVERHKSFVFTLVRRHINEREIAEELAQDVFLKAYRFLGSFRGNSKFSTWLYQITHTTCLSYLRLKKQPQVLPGDDKVNYFSDVSQSVLEHSESLDIKSRQRRVEQALESLEIEDREIVSLFYQGGLKVEEISAVMKMSTSSVKVRLFRSRQKLKKKLRSEIQELR